MQFDSLSFVAFFVGVLLIHQALPPRRRWVLLLLASYFFYMCWRAEYALLIAASTVVDYFVGIRLGSARGASRKVWLAISLAVNLGTLVIFKYLGFFTETISSLFGIGDGDPFIQLLLPVGISFYTFQTLSYTIEVYRGKIEPERHFGYFALYVSFFPQLVAGPIERPQNLLPQLRQSIPLDYDRAVSGLQQILWGFFKKLVIADRVAITVDAIYPAHVEHGALTLVVATILFGIQVYCDFSAYSDIAIGSARLLGIDLMQNFRRPYLATSLAGFWRRWHISLSTWFRDYIYFPLGGNRVSKSRWIVNLLVVFLLSGLWHGASMTYVVWGALHGVGLALAVATSGIRQRLAAALGLGRIPRVCSVVNWLVVIVIVNISWIFFRAPTIDDAMAILGTIARLEPGGLFVGDRAGFAFSLLAIAVLIFAELRAEFFGRRFSLFASRSAVVRMGAYAATIMTILLYGVFDGGQFIYFQF